MRWIIATFVCICLLCCAAGYYCWSVMPSASVSRLLADEVHRGAGTVVDFSHVAPFAWDRVFVFHPYTPRTHIDACLGFPWDGSKWSEIESSDGVNLVVFVRDGAVVCWFDHSRRDGELVALADPKGYTREEAKFRVSLDQEQRLVLSK